MGKLAAAALVASLLGLARAGEAPPPRGAEVPATEKASDAKPAPKPKAAKAKKAKVTPPPEEKAAPKAPAGKGEGEKPCEPVKPCPIE